MGTRKTFGYSAMAAGMVFVMSACVLPNRSENSGYAEQDRPLKVVRKSSKINYEGRPIFDADLVSEKTQLKQLENSLSSRKESEQYSKALPWFKSDQERIDFLRLPGFEARQKWLSENDFSSRTGEAQSNMKDLVEAQDIALGMPQNLVRQSWGEPDAIEVSGNPQMKNERWKYNRYVTTQEGYRPEKKIVYFEGGKVVGWELE